MKYCTYLVVLFPIISGMFIVSCSNRDMFSADPMQRLETYIHSDNMYIAEMFFDESIMEYGVQPALTRTEFETLDALAGQIPPSVRDEFDQKYIAWLNCWTPLDSLPMHHAAIRHSLKCNGSEFRDLIKFCRQQDDKIFLLLYQLAGRANCPYDQLLLYPVEYLAGSFPEFNTYWREVNMALQNEKPDLEHRTCNEATIWYTRKMLEVEYGNTYTGGRTALFDARSVSLTTQ